MAQQLFDGRELRKFADCPHEDGEYCDCTPVATTNPGDADLVASIMPGGVLHKPVIDIDLPCAVVPSATPGHGHLYINHGLNWPVYVKVLEALVAAGLVEQGYLNASLVRGYTSVRVPWKPKDLTAVAKADGEAL